MNYVYNGRRTKNTHLGEVIFPVRMNSAESKKGVQNMRAQFITAEEVQQVLGISRSKAYQIVQAMNRELKSAGYITIAGKCPIQYFKQKFYGLQIEGGPES